MIKFTITPFLYYHGCEVHYKMWIEFEWNNFFSNKKCENVLVLNRLYTSRYTLLLKLLNLVLTQSDYFLFQKMWCQSRFEPLSCSFFTAMYRPCRWSVQCRMRAFMGYSTGWPGALTVSRGQGSWWGRACIAPHCLCQPRTSTHWVLRYSVDLSWVQKKDKF